MFDPSLSYEVLIYLNSFYFGMFASCELGMGLLKAINLPYKEHKLAQETSILVLLVIVETVRIVLGRKGALSDRGAMRCFYYSNHNSKEGINFE